MTDRPAEVTSLHTKLLNCTLEVENSRAYWAWSNGERALTAERAFEAFVFGDRSMRRLRELLPRLRARFDAFPPALPVLHDWQPRAPETRVAICHWHVQLSDPLYRRFTGHYLGERWAAGRTQITRDQVVSWVGEQTDRWGASTRIQFASKLLSTAHGAGLVTTTRDPRPLSFPTVPDEALEYLLYLVRGVELDGGPLDNPYLKSVGLEGRTLEKRLEALPNLDFRRQHDLVDLRWHFPDLRAWADHAVIGAEPSRAASTGAYR